MTTVPTFALLAVMAGTAHAGGRGEVIDFSASWCGPCQQIAPTVARLERAGYPIRTVDVDAQRAEAERFQITAMPTFVLMVDDKEVDRHVGAMSEQQLLAWIDRIPRDPPQKQRNQEIVARGQSSSSLAYVADPSVQLGQSRPFGASGAGVADSSRSSSSVSDSQGDGARIAEPFPHSPSDEKPVAFVSTQEPSSHSYSPMQSSVRLRVTINGNINLGSGTIIDCSGGVARILTCGHIFRGLNASSRIEVNLFEGEREKTFVGKVIKYDARMDGADVGLVEIATESPLPFVPVAKASGSPVVDDKVVSIGCSGGQPPTASEETVTAINPYVGPATIECTGIPVQGRSGGGLFNQHGEVAGICIAADPPHKRGVYAGLPAIHDLLKECGLSYLYEPKRPSAASSALAANHEHAEEGAPEHADSLLGSLFGAPPVSPEEVPEREEPSPARLAGTAENKPSAPLSLGPEAEDAEIVCIIRSRSNPEAVSQVVIINRATPKLLSYLRGDIHASPSQMLPEKTAISKSSVREPRRGLVSTGVVSRAWKMSPPPRSRSSLASPLLQTSASAASERSELKQTSLSRHRTPRPYTRRSRSRLASQVR